jgi:hypothetical protein
MGFARAIGLAGILPPFLSHGQQISFYYGRNKLIMYIKK